MAAEWNRIALQRKSRGLSMAIGLRGTKLWELTMRKFRIANKETCKSVSKEMSQKPSPKLTFLTGSTYIGEWTELGMSGQGTYEFPIKKPGQRLVYTGEFDDGMFDGHGTLSYPDGTTIEGRWLKGALQEKKLCFSDGLEYLETGWRYCVFPDRRYSVEYDEGIPPAGRSYIANTPVPREVPDGYYDVGDGLYDPKTKHVVRYDDTTYVMRASSMRESKWIIDNCRVCDATCQPLGPCPFMYDEWLAPALEAESPPPPAARTKQYADDIKEIEEWLKRSSRRESTPFAKRSGLFRATGTSDHGYHFYRPSYLRRSSAGSISSQVSKRGRLTFELGELSSEQGTVVERHRSMFRTGHHRRSTKSEAKAKKVFTDEILATKRATQESVVEGQTGKPYLSKRKESTENSGPIAMPKRINW